MLRSELLIGLEKVCNYALTNHSQDGFQIANQLAEPKQPSCSLHELSSAVPDCMFACFVLRHFFENGKRSTFFLALLVELFSDFKNHHYKNLHF